MCLTNHKLLTLQYLLIACKEETFNYDVKWKIATPHIQHILLPHKESPPDVRWEIHTLTSQRVSSWRKMRNSTHEQSTVRISSFFGITRGINFKTPNNIQGNQLCEFSREREREAVVIAEESSTNAVIMWGNFACLIRFRKEIKLLCFIPVALPCKYLEKIRVNFYLYSYFSSLDCIFKKSYFKYLLTFYIFKWHIVFFLIWKRKIPVKYAWKFENYFRFYYVLWHLIVYYRLSTICFWKRKIMVN